MYVYKKNIVARFPYKEKKMFIWKTTRFFFYLNVYLNKSISRGNREERPIFVKYFSFFFKYRISYDYVPFFVCLLIRFMPPITLFFWIFLVVYRRFFLFCTQNNHRNFSLKIRLYFWCYMLILFFSVWLFFFFYFCLTTNSNLFIAQDIRNFVQLRIVFFFSYSSFFFFILWGHLH